MFVLPTLKTESPIPAEKFPKFSEIKSSSELLSIYRADFVPFCLDSKLLLYPNFRTAKIQRILPEVDDTVFLRSLVRQHDQVILERLFHTFSKFKGELKEEGHKLQVMEIGAGYSYSFNPEHISAPWLSRWLASKFPELDIVVSDIAKYWSPTLETKRFHLKAAISLDYCRLDQQPPRTKHFVFGRHLNELSPERYSDHNHSIQPICDSGYAEHVNCEVDELLSGLRSILKLNGQALIDFDQGPLFDLRHTKMPTFSGTDFNYLEVASSGVRVFPSSHYVVPSLFEE